MSYERKNRKVVVTGGAGYIGSHIVEELLSSNYTPIVLDNFYSGNKWAIPEGVEVIEGSCGDPILLEKIFNETQAETVFHIAGHIDAQESVVNPLKYYNNNTKNSLTLIQSCIEHNVKNFIFSSTAAIYGSTTEPIVKENDEHYPINPYGRSKKMVEEFLEDLCTASSSSEKSTHLNFVALRYFNVAGASPSGRIGQATPGVKSLIKVVAEVHTGKRDRLSIYGTDYPTKDGTGVRDFIHVSDLSQAHIESLAYLERGGKSDVFNCGYGSGFSVLDVVNTYEKITGNKLKIEKLPRRPADPVSVIADNTKITQHMNWSYKYNDLEQILKSALTWEEQMSKIQ